MEKILFISLLFLIVSCVGGYPGAPENSSYSEKNGLLVERFTYPKDTITIFNNQYVIADAWVSHNLKSSNSKEINYNYLGFFCSFKNIKTNEYFIDLTLGDFDNVLSHNVNSYGHGFESLGNKFSHYNLTFKDDNVNNIPDTIKIFVKQNQETKTLNFYKYSSVYK